MAAAAHVTVNVYGQAWGKAPYGTGIEKGGLDSPDRITFWATPVALSFPTTGTVFYPVSPGIQVGTTSNYIYSIVEVQPTGLNVHGDKYVSNQSVATLATNAG
jgi:hypothetical protein